MMRRTMTALWAIGLASGLAACGGPSPDQAPQQQAESGAGQAISTNAAPGSFLLCQSCHAIEPGRNGIGPSLAGVVGRKAAGEPSFSYSPALRAANLTWDRATLDKWLTNPMKMVPGTRMVYGGMADPARRKEMIDYLETLK